MRSRFALIAALAISAFHGPAGALDLSGYVKALLIRSKTLAPDSEPYTLDVNRVRLQFNARPADTLALEAQLDNEVLLGSYLRTTQFKQQQAMAEQYRSYASGGGYEGRYRWYRAFASWTQEHDQLRVGRQRITLGTGRFFSPLDRLNPPSPVTIERQERDGVDALLYEHRLGPLSRVNAFYSRGIHDAAFSTGLAWRGNVMGTDMSVVAGKFGDDRLVGFDVAGQIAGAGVRAEWTHTQPRAGDRYRRVLLGIDYAFANTLTLTGELYYDGAGAAEPDRYDIASLLAGRIQNVGRSYLALFASYDITPLLKSANHVVINLEDRSWFASPELRLSLSGNLDFSVGVQWYRGPARGEYRQFRDLSFAQLQWFF